MSLKEQKLLEKIRNGDSESFGKIYDLHVDEVYKFVYLKVSEKEVAEEITQDVFWKLWTYLRLENNEERSILNVRAWLYRTARNMVIDHYRRTGSSPDVVSIELTTNSVDESDIDKEIDVQIDIQNIQTALKKLPENYREVIIMKFVNEMEYSEIAKILEKEEGNVRVLVYRAIKKLKKILEI